MADQYQNFSNPTIVPDQKYGWEAANASAQGAQSGIAQYLMQQQQARQGIQLKQAETLSNYQNIIQASTGQRNPNIDAMLAQNPYGRQMVPQGQPQPQQGQGGQPSPMMGGGMFGAMGTPSPSISSPTMGGMGGQGSAPTMSGSMGGGMFNPLNNASPIVTGQSQTFAPFGDMGPKTTTTTANPQAEAQVAGAKSYADKSAAAQQGAQESETRDIQQLAMVKNAIKPLVDSYNQVQGSSILGMPGAGDNYGSSIIENADKIPQLGGMQNRIVPPEVQKAAGQFLSNKNELVTKLQPLLSQQFGKEGSSRIMESLINMSQQEIGGLNTPKAQFQGQISGTLSSLYRIAKASQAYSQDLQQSGQPNPDPNVATQEIAKRMSMQNLSPNEQKELGGMIDDVLGNNKLTSGAQLNPVSSAKSQVQAPQIPKYNPSTQKLQQNSRTGEYRVVSL